MPAFEWLTCPLRRPLRACIPPCTNVEFMRACAWLTAVGIHLVPGLRRRGSDCGCRGGGGGALVAEADSPDVEAAGRGGGRRGRGGNAFGNVDTNVDMMPGSSTDIMTAIADIPMPIETRDQVKAHLSAHGFAKTTVQWLLSNLRSVVPYPPTGAPPGAKKTRTLEWRFDIGIARALIEDASRVDSLPLLTCRFRADGKVSVTVPIAVSPALSLSPFLR